MREGILLLKFKYCKPSSASHNGRDKIGRHQIHYIGYPDDLILTFGDSTDLRRALKLLDELFGSFSLAINHQYANNIQEKTILAISANYTESQSRMWRNSSILGAVLNPTSQAQAKPKLNFASILQSLRCTT